MTDDEGLNQYLYALQTLADQQNTDAIKPRKKYLSVVA